MRGSDFAELKAFVAVVERQSFARAAEHLGLSPSALSQTIRQLESRIGTRLLNRTTRSVAPSASGEQLYRRVAPLFREMAVAVAEAREATGQMSGTLRINTLGIAARTIIAPRLARFHQAHPDIVLDIVVDDALADIVAGRFDAGIRVGGQLEKDMVAIRLTPDLNMVAVASPDYLARRGTPKSPADLHDHACINWRLQMEGRHYRWEFEKDEQRIEVAVDGPIVTNHADVGIAAALNGLGIAYHFEQDGVGELLAQGRLVDHTARAVPLLPEPAASAGTAGCLYQLSAGSKSFRCAVGAPFPDRACQAGPAAASPLSLRRRAHAGRGEPADYARIST